MMRGLLCFVALVLLSSAAFSEPVTVKSGEHGAYTRLVATVPAGTEWRLDQQGHVARLTVELDTVTFDLSGVFKRISRTRLTELKQEKPGKPLELELGCKCVVNSFLHAETMIVMDIAPGDADRQTTSVLPQKPSVLAVASMFGEEELLGNTVPPLSFPLLKKEAIQLKSGSETAVASRLIRGADQQVLDLNLAGIGPRNTIAAAIGQGLLVDSTLSNISISTALDLELDAISTEQRSIAQHQNCVDDIEFGFEQWSDGAPYADQIANSRSRLYSEFDRVNSEQALQLARIYAYFGFGAEAEQVLQLASTEISDHRFVTAVAFLTEGKSLEPPHPFTNQQGCDTGVALWGLLADGFLASDARLPAIELAFARLPHHLRNLFADDVARIFAEAGKVEAARRVLTLIEGQGLSGGAELNLAKGEMARVERDLHKEEAFLSAAATTERQVDVAPVALIKLIQKRWAERSAATEQDVELAASFALQYRQSELGQKLALTHILALALNNQFDQSFAKLPNIVGGKGESEDVRTLDQVVTLLVERAEDLTFLRHVLRLSTDQIGVLSSQTVSDIAERLTDMGFAHAAVPFAKYLGQGREPSKHSTTLARVSQGIGQPHRSLLELDGEESEAADWLRVRAYSDVGDADRAVEILRRLGDTEAMARLLWLSEDWTQAQDLDAEKYSRLAEMAAKLGSAEPSSDEPPLASARTMLKASQQERADIADMLNALEKN